jgi:hypothetical protein
MYLVNKNVVNLIDDVFWKMGFKTETDAENFAKRLLFEFYHLFWIIHLIQINLTVSVLGLPGSGNCRSRVAGQTR